MIRKIFVNVEILFFVFILSGSVFGSQPKPLSRDSALYGLPSPEGQHVKKIRDLAADKWLSLGIPQDDPNQGGVFGRSYTPKMAFAPGLRGAFVYGQGGNRFIRPDGRIQDGLWFFDINANAWICCYPGTDCTDPQLTFGKNDLWQNARGKIVPVGVRQAQHQVTYNSTSRIFAAMTSSSFFSIDAIKGKVGLAKGQRYGAFQGPQASPWFWDVASGKWQRYLTKAPTPKIGSNLLWIPRLKKYLFWNRPKMHFYDPKEKRWEMQTFKGKIPPSGSAQSAYDPKRQLLFIIGPAAPPKSQKLFVYDIQKKEWRNARAGQIDSIKYRPSGRSAILFDTANGVLLLFQFEQRTIHAYDPKADSWSRRSYATTILPGKYEYHNCFYDSVLNVHFIHSARMSKPGGEMWVYRYGVAKKSGG
jgi:hypothetical protein